MQHAAQGEDQSDDDADRRGKPWRPVRKRPEQIGGEQGDFTGHADILAALAPVGEQDQSADEGGADGENRHAREFHRQRAGQRDDGMGAYAAGCTHLWITALASLALDTYQKTDAQGHEKTRVRSLEHIVEHQNAFKPVSSRPRDS